MSIPDNTENDEFSFKMAMARTDILKAEKGIATAKSMCNSSFRGCIRSIIGREDGSLGNFVKKLLVVIKTKHVKQDNTFYSSSLESSLINFKNQFSIIDRDFKTQCKAIFENADNEYKNLIDAAKIAFDIHTTRYKILRSKEKNIIMSQIYFMQRELEEYSTMSFEPHDKPTAILETTNKNEHTIEESLKQATKRILSIRKKYELLISLAHKDLKELMVGVFDYNTRKLTGIPETDYTTIFIEVHRLTNILQVYLRHSTPSDNLKECFPKLNWADKCVAGIRRFQSKLMLRPSNKQRDILKSSNNLEDVEAAVLLYKKSTSYYSGLLKQKLSSNIVRIKKHSHFMPGGVKGDQIFEYKFVEKILTFSKVSKAAVLAASNTTHFIDQQEFKTLYNDIKKIFLQQPNYNQKQMSMNIKDITMSMNELHRCMNEWRILDYEQKLNKYLLQRKQSSSTRTKAPSIFFDTIMKKVNCFKQKLASRVDHVTAILKKVFSQLEIDLHTAAKELCDEVCSKTPDIHNYVTVLYKSRPKYFLEGQYLSAVPLLNSIYKEQMSQKMDCVRCHYLVHKIKKTLVRKRQQNIKQNYNFTLSGSILPDLGRVFCHQVATYTKSSKILLKLLIFLKIHGIVFILEKNRTQIKHIRCTTKARTFPTYCKALYRKFAASRLIGFILLCEKRTMLIMSRTTKKRFIFLQLRILLFKSRKQAFRRVFLKMNKYKNLSLSIYQTSWNLSRLYRCFCNVSKLWKHMYILYCVKLLYKSLWRIELQNIFIRKNLMLQMRSGERSILSYQAGIKLLVFSVKHGSKRLSVSLNYDRRINRDNVNYAQILLCRRKAGIMQASFNSNYMKKYHECAVIKSLFQASIKLAYRLKDEKLLLNFVMTFRMPSF